MLTGNFDINEKIRTSGVGLWSSIEKDVYITNISWIYKQHNDEYLLDIFFDDSWNIEEDGLIYTDGTFIINLKQQLLSLRESEKIPELPYEKLSYTEQGMQGREYVSMILGDW